MLMASKDQEHQVDARESTGACTATNTTQSNRRPHHIPPASNSTSNRPYPLPSPESSPPVPLPLCAEASGRNPLPQSPPESSSLVKSLSDSDHGGSIKHHQPGTQHPTANDRPFLDRLSTPQAAAVQDTRVSSAAVKEQRILSGVQDGEISQGLHQHAQDKVQDARASVAQAHYSQALAFLSSLSTSDLPYNAGIGEEDDGGGDEDEEQQQKQTSQKHHSPARWVSSHETGSGSLAPSVRHGSRSDQQAAANFLRHIPTSGGGNLGSKELDMEDISLKSLRPASPSPIPIRTDPRSSHHHRGSRTMSKFASWRRRFSSANLLSAEHIRLEERERAYRAEDGRREAPSIQSTEDSSSAVTAAPVTPSVRTLPWVSSFGQKLSGTLRRQRGREHEDSAFGGRGSVDPCEPSGRGKDRKAISFRHLLDPQGSLKRGELPKTSYDPEALDEAVDNCNSPVEHATKSFSFQAGTLMSTLMRLSDSRDHPKPAPETSATTSDAHHHDMFPAPWSAVPLPGNEISIPISQLCTLKRKLIDLQDALDLDLSTVAISIVYLEKLCLQGMVDKDNRKVMCATCILLAAKVNEPKERDMRQLMDEAENVLEASPKDVREAEFEVWANLDFGLYVRPGDLLPHFQKLLGQCGYKTPEDYLGPKYKFVFGDC